MGIIWLDEHDAGSHVRMTARLVHPLKIPWGDAGHPFYFPMIHFQSPYAAVPPPTVHAPLVAQASVVIGGPSNRISGVSDVLHEP